MENRGKRISRFEGNIGWAIGCRHTGVSHKRSNIPCQDAYNIEFNPQYIIIAVADGHGNKKHDLSHHGSLLAVNTASEILTSFYTNFGSEGSSSELKKTFREDFPRRVTREWRKSVIEYERKRIEKDEVSENQDLQKIYTRYGTTLLACLITPDVILLGQIGDGDILSIGTNGVIETVFQKDPNLVGNETYSLSSQEAYNLWQTAVFDTSEEKRTLLMATDGLSNSFADDNQFYVFANSLLERIREFGLQQVSDAMPQWFETFSERGSGDDITVVIASTD
jgi:serine/threonine protein phosphatase PrpC